MTTPETPIARGKEDPGLGYLRIATEEAFCPPELARMWQELLDGPDVDPGFESLVGLYMRSSAERPKYVAERLQDLGDLRLHDMDATGIDRQIISLTTPGTQIFEDPAMAKSVATLANRFFQNTAPNVMKPIVGGSWVAPPNGFKAPAT